uniref:BHLH domain-containing protein n=1 Tax=Sus scrofa TaxID=9823 RepID=A0A8D1IHY6_PIG
MYFGRVCACVCVCVCVCVCRKRNPKLLPPEGAKSNPSKRHRDRLNQELSKLSRLLPFPEDVRARLDKLSILRLIVGYLKVKSYFTACPHPLSSSRSTGSSGNPGQQGGSGSPTGWPEGGRHALDGFLVAVSEDGYVFYVSPTVQDYLGFHQVSDFILQLRNWGASEGGAS